MEIVQGRREQCKPTKSGLGKVPEALQFLVITAHPDGLKLIELPVEKTDIGKISPNKTVHHLALSKREKGDTNVAESF